MICPTTVNSTICVEANVKINADVEVGEVDTCCMGRPFIRRCRTQDNRCVCMVFQRMRVRFPLTYTTNVTAHSTGVSCDSIDTCSHPQEKCQDNTECSEEPKRCKNCGQESGECNKDIKNCSQEGNECSQRSITKHVRRNRFHFPFSILLAIFCGACFHF